jgi:DNA-binding PadR family transcriptional regulator
VRGAAERGGIMGKADRNPEDLLPLSPAVFHILLALADADMHGYAIMQDVDARTGGKVKIGPGTLYGSVKRMLEEGLIVECDERPDPHLDDERRRYYRLAEFGRRVAAAEASRLAKLVSTARAKKLLRGTEPA